MKICEIGDCKKPSSRFGMCQMHAWRLKHHGSALYEHQERKCQHEGCSRKHKAHGLCALHLGRKKKGLPMDAQLVTLNPKRYRQITARNHPLAWKNGRVSVHRKVLFDAVGGSRMPCHWCGTPLYWGDNLVVDHIDHDRHNNQSTNLVPSCASCNCGRMIICQKPRISIYQPA